MTVVNLFALRSPTPSALVAHRDAVGPGNDAAVAAQRSRAGVELVVAAWGGHPLAIRRGAEMLERLRPLQCLGVTRGGAPRHPLYLPRETRVSPFEPRSLPRPEPSAAR
jgi:hypothetical protein